MAGAVEGGSTLFEDYLTLAEKHTLLNLGNYMLKQVCLLLKDCTQLHLHLGQKNHELVDITEFWHAEMEVAWANNNEIMNHGEGVVRHIAKTILDRRSDELNSLAEIWTLSQDMPTTLVLELDTMKQSVAKKWE